MTYRTLACVAIATLCVAVATPAIAEQREPVSVAVSTSGINPASINGISRIDARAAAAINDACTPQLWGIGLNVPDMRCRSEMRRDAANKIATLQHPGL